MKTKQLLIVASLAFLLVALPLLAVAQNNNGRGRGFNHGPGRGMMDGGQGYYLGGPGCNFADLNLTADQQALYDDMRDAVDAFHETQWQINWKVREQMLAELAKGNHNLTAVAAELKSEHGKAFDEMIDARAALFSSLSDEQVQQLQQAPVGRRGGGQGQFQGKGRHRGGW